MSEVPPLPDPASPEGSRLWWALWAAEKELYLASSLPQWQEWFVSIRKALNEEV